MNQIPWTENNGTTWYTNAWHYKIDNYMKLLYILEQRISWSTSRIRPAWPCSGLRLSPILASPYEHASCCHAQPGSLLFIAKVQVSHLAPLLSGWLVTNVQVNITTTPHNIWAHVLYSIYVHHISITIHSFFFLTHLPFSWAGWLCPNHIVRHT